MTAELPSAPHLAAQGKFMIYWLAFGIEVA
jgi:hypothetical protein